ncbi:unnamed protein product [Rhizophagus irregularis]|nr:unnamed protein product [Rhizophagus irregularis]
MIKYTVRSVKKIIYECGNEYDKRLIMISILLIMHTGVCCFYGVRKNPFDSSKLEGWYEMIDPTFHNTIIDLVRSDGMSCASSDRKNIVRTINDRKRLVERGRVLGYTV